MFKVKVDLHTTGATHFECASIFIIQRCISSITIHLQNIFTTTPKLPYSPQGSPPTLGVGFVKLFRRCVAKMETHWLTSCGTMTGRIRDFKQGCLGLSDQPWISLHHEGPRKQTHTWKYRKGRLWKRRDVGVERRCQGDGE